MVLERILTYEDKAVLILRTELLIARAVIEHYRRTDSEALKVKALIIFKNLALFAGYYFDFCFRTFRIAI